MLSYRATPGRFCSPRARRGSVLKAETRLNASGGLFPFDGKCDGSKNADLTISFAGAENLKANSRHLKEGSTVLGTAIQNCVNQDMLHAGDDNRDAWVTCLNLVHPGRRIGSLEENGECLVTEKMEVYAAFAQKYGVACMHDFVDSSLCRAVDKEKCAMLSRNSTGDKGSTADCFSEDSFLLKCSRLAAMFGLEAAKEANLSYFEEIVKRLNKAIDDEILERKEMGPLMATFVAFLSRHGQHEYACLLAERAFRLLRT